MKPRVLFIGVVIAVAMGLVAASSGNPAYAVGSVLYKVTIENMTDGQPLSSPVVATHKSGITMFKAGTAASPELEAIAEDGNPGGMVTLFGGSVKVTEVVDVGAPLTPFGSSAGGFADAATFVISANPGDKLSLATMLICTNDGFTGLNGAKLPKQGAKVYLLNAYDAGTEDNTEASGDIVDPCSVLSPVGLSGDPNGNQDALVDTSPHGLVALHANIQGVGNLDTDDHGWGLPIARVTITRIDDSANSFIASLNGVSENPPVNTFATGKARFTLNEDETELTYYVSLSQLINTTAAHIHMQLPDKNGSVVAFLFGPATNSGVINGKLASGTITQANLVGPLAGNFAGFVDGLRNGGLYANAHTPVNPSGEIRGQIGTR